MTSGSEAEAKVLRIAEEMRKKGKPIPRSLHELPDFPFSTFESLREALAQRRMLMQRFSIHCESDIFNLFASRFQCARFSVYLALVFLLPVAAIVLAFAHSWWWLALAFGAFLALTRIIRERFYCNR